MDKVVKIIIEIFILLGCLLMMSYFLNKMMDNKSLRKIKHPYDMILIFLSIIVPISLLIIGIGIFSGAHGWIMFQLILTLSGIMAATFIWAFLSDTKPVKVFKEEFLRFIERLIYRWGRWNNARLKKFIIFLSVIILLFSFYYILNRLEGPCLPQNNCYPASSDDDSNIW